MSDVDRKVIEALMSDDDCTRIDLLADELLGRPAWMKSGACVGSGVTFFPRPGHWDERDRAKRLCASCAVRDDCLAYALADVSLVGVWGGTDEQQRVRLRSRKRRAA